MGCLSSKVICVSFPLPNSQQTQTPLFVHLEAVGHCGWSWSWGFSVCLWKWEYIILWWSAGVWACVELSESCDAICGKLIFMLGAEWNVPDVASSLCPMATFKKRKRLRMSSFSPVASWGIWLWDDAVVWFSNIQHLQASSLCFTLPTVVLPPLLVNTKAGRRNSWSYIGAKSHTQTFESWRTQTNVCLYSMWCDGPVSLYRGTIVISQQTTPGELCLFSCCKRSRMTSCNWRTATTMWFAPCSIFDF